MVVEDWMYNRKRFSNMIDGLNSEVYMMDVVGAFVACTPF